MTFVSSLRTNFVVSSVPLDAPTGLSLTVDSDTEITLDWTDVASDGVVVIERSLDGVTFEEIDEVDVTTETFQDTGLEPSTEYFYRIRGFFLPIGYSAYSDIESDTTDP